MKHLLAVLFVALALLVETGRNNGAGAKQL